MRAIAQGLGKTLQSISILAYMLEFKRVAGPHLVLVPKTTLANWMGELRRWCPRLRALQFHGPKEQRAAFVQEHLRAGAPDAARAAPADARADALLASLAEATATDDVLYELDAALSDGRVDLDDFLRDVRRVAHRQFLVKARAAKVAEAL